MLMLRGRIGTMALGGFAAFLLINKAMNLVGRTVEKVCDTSKWKAYYKHNKNDSYSVPPGYCSFTRPVNNNQEWVVAKEEPKKEAEPKKDGSGTSLGASIAEGILKVIKDKLDGVEAPEGASEGETEASEPSNEGEVMSKTVDEEDISEDSEEDDSGRYPFDDKPHDYAAFMTYIHDCESKGMSEKEIALSLGMDVSTLRRGISDAEDILRKQESEPLYTDDLVDGVKVVEDDELDLDIPNVLAEEESNEDLD